MTYVHPSICSVDITESVVDVACVLCGMAVGVTNEHGRMATRAAAVALALRMFGQVCASDVLAGVVDASECTMDSVGNAIAALLRIVVNAPLGSPPHQCEADNVGAQNGYGAASVLSHTTRHMVTRHGDCIQKRVQCDRTHRYLFLLEMSHELVAAMLVREAAIPGCVVPSYAHSVPGGGWICIHMAYAGMAMDEWLAMPERTWAETAGVLVQIGDTIATIHAHSIAVLDIKLQNICVAWVLGGAAAADEDGCSPRGAWVAKIIDVGSTVPFTRPRDGRNPSTRVPVMNDHIPTARGSDEFEVFDCGGLGTPGYRSPVAMIDVPWLDEAKASAVHANPVDVDWYSFLQVVASAMQRGANPAWDMYIAKDRPGLSFERWYSTAWHGSERARDWRPHNGFADYECMAYANGVAFERLVALVVASWADVDHSNRHAASGDGSRWPVARRALLETIGRKR